MVFSVDTSNQAVEALQTKLSLPKPPFSGHSAIPPASGIPQPSFPGQPGFPTSSYQPVAAFCSSFSWLTTFLSSSKQRQASVPSLVFLANQASPPASTNQQQQSADVFLSNQGSQQQQVRTSVIPQPSFPGQSGFPPAATSQRQQSAEVFLANQGSQQQQARTSVIPQPSFSWPTRIPQQQLPTSSSNLQKFSWLTRIPSSSKQEQALFPSLVFPGQPGFPSSSYQPAAAICRSFPG